MTVEEVIKKCRHNRTTEDPVDLRLEYADEITPYAYPRPISLEEPTVPWTFFWDWLQYRIHTNDFDDIHIGDWVVLRVRHEKRDPSDLIYHQDRFTMEVSGIGKDYIDFISKELIPYRKAWNSVTKTNCGYTGDYPIPWNNVSSINKFLNGDFYSRLVSDLKNAIIEKECGVEVKHFTLPSDPRTFESPREYNGSKLTKIGMLWLPNELETFGGDEPVLSNKDVGIKGIQYKTLDTPEKRTKKCLGEDTPSVWPTLSIVDNSLDKIVGVNEHGELCEISVDANVGFPVCFRIGGLNK